MGTLYCIDMHTSVINNSEINDTVVLDSGTFPMAGSFIVRVPFEVSVKVPTSLTDLITQKHTNTLALHPGFTHILFDDQLDATGWNATSSTKVTLGKRQTNSAQTTGILQSVMTTLGSIPSTAIMTWEVFRVNLTDPATGLQNRTYEEMPTTDMACTVSFDNGAHFIAATDKVPFTINDTGNQFIVKFTNGSGERRWMGSWALVY